MAEAAVFITIEMADHGDFHQPGYDISLCVEEEGKEPVIYYKEVKTHTPGSQCLGQIRLSNEQMILAAKAGEHYSVLEVVYDHRAQEGVSVRELHDLIRLIGDRTLQNMQKGYQFQRSA